MTQIQFELFHIRSGSPLSLRVLKEKLDELDVEDDQRQRIEEFYFNKSAFLREELRPCDFENLKTIGIGSGGVVWKSLHKPSSVIVARKVRLFFCFLS